MAKILKSNVGFRPYQGLGVPQNCSDDLILKGYQAQCQTAPEFVPYFFTYLRQIATDRNSEILITEVAMESSQGRYDIQQLEEAYKYFGLDMQDGHLNDDLILGTFSSRLEDSKNHEVDMRDNLRMIGVHRNSKRIIEFADNCQHVPCACLEDVHTDLQ